MSVCLDYFSCINCMADAFESRQQRSQVRGCTWYQAVPLTCTSLRHILQCVQCHLPLVSVWPLVLLSKITALPVPSFFICRVKEIHQRTYVIRHEYIMHLSCTCLCFVSETAHYDLIHLCSFIAWTTNGKKWHWSLNLENQHVPHSEKVDVRLYSQRKVQYPISCIQFDQGTYPDGYGACHFWI